MKARYLTTALLLAGLVSAATAIALEPDDDGYFPVSENFADANSAVIADGSSGCGDCGGECDNGCGPRWTIMAGGVYMHRSNDFSFILAEQGAAETPNVAGAELVNTNDFNLGWETGGSLDLIYHRECGYDIGISYFGNDAWSATSAFAGADFTLPIAVDLGGIVAGTLYDATAGTYSSEINSVEFNLRHQRSDRIVLLAGFRWVELNERFNGAFTGDAGADSFTASLNTDNDLYGFQVGVEAILLERCCGKFRVDGWLKVGIYGSNQNHRGAVDGLGGNVVDVAANTTVNNTSFLGEIGAKGFYKITDRLSAYAGYQAMWIDGVALAPDQIALAPAGLVGVDTSGNPFYHGANFGIRYIR